MVWDGLVWSEMIYGKDEQKWSKVVWDGPVWAQAPWYFWQLRNFVTPWDIATTVLDLCLHGIMRRIWWWPIFFCIAVHCGPYYVTDMVVADVMRNILSPRLQYHSALVSDIQSLSFTLQKCKYRNTHHSDIQTQSLSLTLSLDSVYPIPSAGR